MELIPVFPLPNVVLYPNAKLALHIFEPRYRAMVEDALAADRMIAMASFLPEWEKEYEGNPAIRQVVCVGEITTHARLKDGRFVMSIAGRYKADVISEDFDLPYRRARLAKAEERLSPEELLIAPRKAEETLAIWRAAAKGYEEGETAIPQSSPTDEVGIIALSYNIADALKVDNALKIELLEMDSALERLETERTLLSGVAEALKMGPRRSEPAFYGFSLN